MFEISPGDLLRLLMEQPTHMSNTNLHGYNGVFDVACEGIPVAKVVPLDINVGRHYAGDMYVLPIALACASPEHGVHPKLKSKVERIDAILRRMGYIPDQTPCEQCREGWVYLNDPSIAKVKTMALSFGVFRGVKLPITKEQVGRLNTEFASSMLGLLSPPSSSMSGLGREPEEYWNCLTSNTFGPRSGPR